MLMSFMNMMILNTIISYITVPTVRSFSHTFLATACASAWSQQVKYLGIMIVNVKITLSTIESEDDYRCQFFTSLVALNISGWKLSL